MSFQSAIKDEEFTQEHGINKLQAALLIGVALAEQNKPPTYAETTPSAPTSPVPDDWLAKIIQLDAEAQHRPTKKARRPKGRHHLKTR